MTRYLVYAIGEVLLVMIGILLALQVNNWNNEKMERTEERKILQGMNETLSYDLNRFQSRMEKVLIAEDRIQTLKDIVHAGIRVDTIDVLCGAVYGTHSFDLNTSSYEVLKSSGLNLIKDDSIRQLIVRIYDTHLKYILGSNFIETNVVLEALRPYYLSNFYDIRFLENATPKDIDKIYKDDYYHNLIDYRLTVIKSNIISNHPNVIKDMKELLDRIDGYLAS